MGSTRWHYAGLSLILDDSWPDQGRATDDSSRPHKYPRWPLCRMANSANFIPYGDVIIRNN